MCDNSKNTETIELITVDNDFEKDIKTIKNTLLVFLGIAFLYLLKVLSNLFIPLALALFVALLLYPILRWFQEKKIPYVLSLTFILVVSFYVFNGIGELIFQTILEILREQDKLLMQIHNKFLPLLDFAKNTLKLNLDDLSGSLWETASKYISVNHILVSSGTFAGFIKSVASILFMTLLYLIVMMGGILNYERYLNYLEQKSSDENGSLTHAFEQIKTSITTYVKVKFLMSLFTGLIYWFICEIFGIDFALFWGFLAFLLNFIPTFGSILATIPPVILGWIQIPLLAVFLLFALCLVAVQIVLGNILDPMLMGSSLSINTIFVLLGLVTWTYLWGVVGTFLSVPMLVLMKVVLQQIPDAHFLVRLMGRPGSMTAPDLESLIEA